MRSKILEKNRYLISALLVLIFYLAVTQIAQTLLYTIVAYVVSAAEKTGTDFGNTVNEIAGQYHFFSYSLAALLMTLTSSAADKALYRHSSFWNDSHQPFWQLNRITKEELYRGLSSGALACVIYLCLLLASKRGGFLGIYITSTLGTPIFPLFFLDLATLCLLLFCEEYIFRHKILPLLLNGLPAIPAVLFTAAAYTSVKYLQFELSSMDVLNIFLMNLVAGFFFLKSQKAHRGIGFVMALVVILHLVAGLSLWDNESPSFFLFKPNGRSHEIFFGGGSGPFSGLALSSILLFFILGGAYSWKKDLEARR